MRTPLPELPRPGQFIGQYEILTQVGHGGMAAVYAVARRSGGFEKILAMKVLLPHLAADRRFVARFLDEAQISAQLQHPHIVSTFDVGETRTADGVAMPYLVMEYLRGQSLARVLEAPSLPPQALLRVLAAAARGLHGAHEARDAGGQSLGIVHRDVSPQNIHLGYDGIVKILDFGIAAAVGKTQATASGELNGKPRYLAPEQIHRRAPIDRRTDVFAFGAVAFQALTGQPLFDGASAADTLWNVLHKSVPDPLNEAPWLPHAAADILLLCLARAPDDRPPTLASVAEVLELAAAEVPDAPSVASLMQARFAVPRAEEEASFTAARARTGRPTPSRPARRWRVLALASVGAVSIGAGSLAIAAWAASPEDAGETPERPVAAPIREDSGSVEREIVTHEAAATEPEVLTPEPADESSEPRETASDRARERRAHARATSRDAERSEPTPAHEAAVTEEPPAPRGTGLIAMPL